METDSSIQTLIAEDARQLSGKLHAHRLRLFPPAANKALRRFTSGEAAKLVGINDGYLRQLSLDGKGPQLQLSPTGRRSYTLADIHELRSYLDEAGRQGRRYSPRRRGTEHLQVIATVNFKGGSGKTTTAAHLAQYLTLQGYRVLAVDLDPQASLSALHGIQPEMDVEPDQTLFGAIRYDERRRDLSTIIRPTYFPGLDIVPGHLELMEFEHDTPKELAARRGTQRMFFARVAQALATVENAYDVVVIDCPPQLGFLTLSALCAATSLLITVHPQMLDVMSMCQFLAMTSDLLQVVADAGGNMNYDWMRYLITRYEPGDAPQTQMVTFMRSLFEDRVLTNPMVKSTAISDAGLTKQTLYEVSREQFTRATYDRAMESLQAVNGEIETLVRHAWGRS